MRKNERAHAVVPLLRLKSPVSRLKTCFSHSPGLILPDSSLVTFDPRVTASIGEQLQRHRAGPGRRSRWRKRNSIDDVLRDASFSSVSAITPFRAVILARATRSSRRPIGGARKPPDHLVDRDRAMLHLGRRMPSAWMY